MIRKDDPENYLKKQLVFYGSYHTNKWNQLIHFIFVPMILWSYCVLIQLLLSSIGLEGIPLTRFLPSSLVPVLPYFISSLRLNAPFLVMIVYSIYYSSLEPVAGLAWTTMVGAPLWVLASVFPSLTASPVKYAALANALGWYMQIHPGHALLEGRKPALMDSLVQAFATAPLFVFLELMFLVGYRPELKHEVEKEVAKVLKGLQGARGTGLGPGEPKPKEAAAGVSGRRRRVLAD